MDAFLDEPVDVIHCVRVYQCVLVFLQVLVADTSHVLDVEAAARVHPQCLRGSALVLLA